MSAANQVVARYILNCRWQLKFQGISKKHWRKRIAEAFLKKFPGQSDAFIEVWSTLGNEGLL